jgi:hypothetical protein
MIRETKKQARKELLFTKCRNSLLNSNFIEKEERRKRREKT